MTRRDGIRVAVVIALCLGALALAAPPPPNSYAPVDDRETFDATKARLEKDKAAVNAAFQKLLGDRYDLSDKPVPGLTSSGRGKPLQGGVRVKLPKGVAGWVELAAMSPEEIKNKDLFPAGFLPLPHDKHAEGGMLFHK